MSALVIFVGPKKTGTSWLHQVVSGSTRAKEVRYPARFGRGWVYRRYVRGESLLIWPYLLHERGCLEALLADAASDGRSMRLLVSLRAEADWVASMTRFLGKYGSAERTAAAKARAEWRTVQDNLSWLRARHDVEHVRIIEPDAGDIALMSEVTGVAERRLEAARDTRVYESSESSRLVSRGLVRMFFCVKPFLPADMQEVTKSALLRKVFFRSRRARPVTAERPER